MFPSEIHSNSNTFEYKKLLYMQWAFGWRTFGTDGIVGFIGAEAYYFWKGWDIFTSPRTVFPSRIHSDSTTVVILF